MGRVKYASMGTVECTPWIEAGRRPWSTQSRHYDRAALSGCCATSSRVKSCSLWHTVADFFCTTRQFMKRSHGLVVIVLLAMLTTAFGQTSTPAHPLVILIGPPLSGKS